MADLFGYTPTQSIVAPQSSRINVQAPAGNAFESLQGIMKSIVDLKNTQNQIESQKLQTETQVVAADMQTRRMELANEKALSDAEKAKRKAEEADALRITKVNASTGFELLKRRYDAQVKAIDLDSTLTEPERVAQIKALTADYIATNDASLQKLPPEAMLSLNDHVWGLNNTAQTSINDREKVSLAQEYDTDLSISTPAFMSIQDLDLMKSEYQKNMETARLAGISPRTFGDTQTDLIVSRLNQTLDQRKIIQSYDYGAINSAQAFLSKYLSIDKRNREKVEAAQEKLITLRTQVDDALKTEISRQSKIQNKIAFDDHLNHALREGAIQPNDVVSYKAEYINDGYNKTELEKIGAQTLFVQNGGIVDPTLMPHGTARTETENLRNTKLTTELDGNVFNGKFIDNFANTDPKKFGSIFNDDVTRKITKLKNKAIEISSLKTEEERAQAREALREPLAMLNKELEYANGNLSNENRLAVAAFKLIALGGEFGNVKATYDAINARGGLKYTGSKDLLDKLQNDIPSDLYPEAVAAASAAMSAGWTESEAYTLAYDSFSYQSVQGMDIDVSPQVITEFGSKNIGTLAMGYFEKALRQKDVFGTSDAAFEKQAAVQAVMDGNNPTIRMDGNDLYFSNEEGAVERLTLSNEQWASLKKGLDGMYTADHPEAKGGSKFIFNVGETMANVFGDLASGVKNVYSPVGSAVEAVGSLYDIDAIGNSFSNGWSNMNTFIDDVFYNDNISILDAWRKWEKATDADELRHIQQFQNDFKESFKGSGGDVMTGVEEIFLGKKPELDTNASIADIPFDEMLAYATAPIKGLLNLTVNQAEANNMMPSVTVIDGQKFFSEYNFNKNIALNAEGRHGFDATTKTFTPIPTNDDSEKNIAVEKRSKDIGYGHKIKQSEIDSGMIHGIKYYDKETKQYIPLTEWDALKIFEADMNENLLNALPDWNKKIKEKTGFRNFDDINPQAQAVLTSLAYNVGGETKQWSRIFDNSGLYYPSMSQPEVKQFAADLRRKDNGKNTAGMDNRVIKELVAAGLINDEGTFKDVIAQLPLQNAYKSFKSTL